MFDHIGIKARDLGASMRFYTEALAPLGHVLGYSDDTCAGFGPKDAPALWIYATKEGAGPGTHVAFAAKDHQAVQGFHRKGVEAGGRDNGAPGPREHYAPTYYAAFLIDPDGNNVEAVCLK